MLDTSFGRLQEITCHEDQLKSMKSPPEGKWEDWLGKRSGNALII